jgi:hypothetical protein
MIDLDKLEALLAKATPGEWSVDGLGIKRMNPPDSIARACIVIEDREAKRDNLAAIVAAHNATPELLAELRRLRRMEAAIGEALAAEGCSCECGHHWDEHCDDSCAEDCDGEACERCLGCRVEMAMQAGVGR